MLEQYKWFSFDESNQWNHHFEEALKQGNKEAIMQLIQGGGKLYLDEYAIYHAFTKLSHIDSDEEKQPILEELQHCKIVKKLIHTKHSIFIDTTFHPIECYKLSDRFPILKDSKAMYFPISTTSSTPQFHAEYISQIIGVPNHVVCGYIYGVVSKAKAYFSWVEFRNKNNQEYVIDYESNLILNKEGFYYLRHAEPIKKVSNGDLKNKQVSSFFSYNTPEGNGEIIESSDNIER